MSTKTSIELPSHPKEKEFEEFVAAHLQSASLYVERNIIERGTTEVLELDVITTDYASNAPVSRLIEIKSGGWGFPDLFKLYGWLHYLQIRDGAFVVQETKEDWDFYQSKAQDLDVSLMLIEEMDGAAAILSSLGDTESISEHDVESWRFSYWVERKLLQRLKSLKRTQPSVQRFRALEEYIFEVNCATFFDPTAVDRAKRLYNAYQRHPRIASKCAHEEAGGDFDEEVEGIDKELFDRTFYKCEYTDLQIATYIEHRARLAILKAGVDYKLFADAGENEKAGSTTRNILGFDFQTAPQTFIDGLEELSGHEYFHFYPVFWQCFMWLFGGFILTDYEEREYEELSARTGVPPGEIPNALSAFDLLFPRGGRWLHEASTANLRMLHVFPVPFRGIGANHRRVLYTESGKYKDLEVGGGYTINDLIRWNNLVVEVLS